MTYLITAPNIEYQALVDDQPTGPIYQRDDLGRFGYHTRLYAPVGGWQYVATERDTNITYVGREVSCTLLRAEDDDTVYTPVYSPRAQRAEYTPSVTPRSYHRI